jgi:hypothetical protein
MAAFTLSANAPALQTYYARLEKYRGLGVTNEMAIRQAFANLLEDVSTNVAWTLILEQTLDNRARPDGVLLDNLRIPRGYWEAKDTKEVRQAHLPLEIEITQKIAKGYPTFNTIFENSESGILYQDAFPLFHLHRRGSSEISICRARVSRADSPFSARFNPPH